MNPRYSDAPVSPTRALTVSLSGILSVVLPMKESCSRALSQNSIVTGTLALVLCLLVLLSVATSAQALVEGEDFKAGQVVVKLEPTVGATIEKINADYGLSTLDDSLGSKGIYLLRVPAGSDTEEVVGRLENDTRLLFAEPNFVAVAPEGPGGDARHKAYDISPTDGSVRTNRPYPYGLRHIQESISVAEFPLQKAALTPLSAHILSLMLVFNHCIVGKCG